jgi:pimeloyl-ACP methyl ester carboxylesterase
VVTRLHYADLPADVREIYPWPGQDLKLSNGHNLHYLDEGSGPPLLMVHGNPTWSFYWRPLVAGLSTRFRCVVPDHLGCGLSDKPQDWDYTMANHAANVVALIDKLDLRDITLVLHDWGGAIGMSAALQRSDRVARVVIFNTAAFYGPLPQSIQIARRPLIGELAVRGLNGFALAALWTASGDRKNLKGAVGRGYLAPYRSWRDRIAHLAFIRDIPLEADHPTRPAMEELEARFASFADRPTLIIWGAKDFVFTKRFLARWTQAYPDAEVHSLEEAGHYVVEDEGPQIVELMSEWLGRHPIPSREPVA